MKFSFLFAFFLLNAVHGLSGPKGAPGESRLGDTCSCDIEKRHQSIVRHSCIGGMIWNKTCVYLPYTTGKDVTYDEAVRVCDSSGAELIKITNDKMYDVVYDYLNRTWVGNTYRQRRFWLGMTFEPVNNPDHLITITPEWKITLNRWRPYYPIIGSKYATFVNMEMRVILRGESSNGGISNFVPTGIPVVCIPVCQYQL